MYSTTQPSVSATLTVAPRTTRARVAAQTSDARDGSRAPACAGSAPVRAGSVGDGGGVVVPVDAVSPLTARGGGAAAEEPKSPTNQSAPTAPRAATAPRASHGEMPRPTLGARGGRLTGSDVGRARLRASWLTRRRRVGSSS